MWASWSRSHSGSGSSEETRSGRRRETWGASCSRPSTSTDGLGTRCDPQVRPRARGAAWDGRSLRSTGPSCRSHRCNGGETHTDYADASAHHRPGSSQELIDRLSRVRRNLGPDKASAALLLAGTVLALLWANLATTTYVAFWAAPFEITI